MKNQISFSSFISLLLLIFVVGCASTERIISPNSGNDILDRLAENDTEVRGKEADIITIVGNIDQDLKILKTNEFIRKYYQKVVLVQEVQIDEINKRSDGVFEVVGGKNISATGIKFLFHPERASSVKKLSKGKVVSLQGFVFSRSQGPYELYGASIK